MRGKYKGLWVEMRKHFGRKWKMGFGARTSLRKCFSERISVVS